MFPSKKRADRKTLKINIAKRRKPSYKVGFLALLILVLFIILGKGIQFIGSLNSTMTSYLNADKGYTWNQNSTIYVAFKTQSISVLSYNPSNGNVNILKIPGDTYFELPNGYGSWRVGSIYDLGQEESPPVGAKLLKNSLAKLLGLPIDGIILSSSKQDISNVIKSWRTNPLGPLSYYQGIKSDFTPVEIFELFRALSKARADKIYDLDIATTSITESQLLPDSSRVLGIDAVALDLFVRDKMSDSIISQENVPVAIYNGTSHPGLAQDVSRIVTNLGGNVIFTSNTDNFFNRSSMVINKTSLTSTRLTQIFAPRCLKNKCLDKDPRIENDRAQVNIILGEDYYKTHYQKGG